MKNKFAFILIVIGITLAFVAGCANSPTPEATALVETVTTGPLPTATPEVFEPQMLLEQAVDNFLTASSLQMKTHDFTSYEAIAADGSIRAVYGEFKSIYDIYRSPELKIRVQSQFRFDPASDFTSEEYYLFEREGLTYMLTFNEDGATSVEEIGGRAIESLIGDAYQAIFLYGQDAEFIQQDGDEAVYLLAPEAWYTLSGAAGFADLGLLYSAPDGLELVKAYAEEHYPDVQPVSFILHVSIADQVMTSIEGDNRAFIQSFFAAYDQALIDQGADPSQLTTYVIQPEHRSEIMVGSYDQVPDFDIPE